MGNENSPLRTTASACDAATGECSNPPKTQPRDNLEPKKREGAITISIVGTNDLHGAIGRLPLLAGYVANLRAARAMPASSNGSTWVSGGLMARSLWHGPSIIKGART